MYDLLVKIFNQKLLVNFPRKLQRNGESYIELNLKLEVQKLK